jgi:hypothetical protein
MFKVLFFLWRKPDLSRQQLIECYETQHALGVIFSVEHLERWRSRSNGAQASAQERCVKPCGLFKRLQE